MCLGRVENILPLKPPRLRLKKRNLDYTQWLQTNSHYFEKSKIPNGHPVASKNAFR